ncbi:predicted protein [Botrytis cinerea T4]|uniref:Uncharacterized protein n=1 Tax=Botryotinia fuckeliana (strain T4) TaxID=999810 RepID=G2Y222_BOTF4|nr:predicted protein [Botrytis cinerea T4]
MPLHCLSFRTSQNEIGPEVSCCCDLNVGTTEIMRSLSSQSNLGCLVTTRATRFFG